MKKFLLGFLVAALFPVSFFLLPAQAQQTIVKYLFQLQDVYPATRPVAGHVLYGDGTKWSNALASSIISGGGFSNVVQTSSSGSAVVFSSNSVLFDMPLLGFGGITVATNTTNVTLTVPTNTVDGNFTITGATNYHLSNNLDTTNNRSVYNEQTLTYVGATNVLFSTNENYLLVTNNTYLIPTNITGLSGSIHIYNPTGYSVTLPTNMIHFQSNSPPTLTTNGHSFLSFRFWHGGGGTQVWAAALLLGSGP